jgi:integrase
MPRASKGPRLYKKPADKKNGRSALWVIRDGRRTVGTGCVALPAHKGPPDEAKKALSEYIAEQYRPARKARDIESIPIADVLSVYVDDKGDSIANRRVFEASILRLNEFFGDLMLSEVSTQTCKGYAKSRGAVWSKAKDGHDQITGAGGARRDLEDLRSAIGHHASENLHRENVSVWLPPRGEPRDRWLTRSEVARLLWTCWRYREVQTIHRGELKGEQIETDKRPLRHLCRFILIASYTGTRAGAIATAAMTRLEGRSFVDLERGLFYRLAQGRRATNKRQPPAPVPPRLLAHMRRWVRRGIVREFFVEWNGKPVASVKTALASAVGFADLSTQDGNITPHTFRHTAATWLMQRGADIWQASGYLGMSPEILTKTYGHHHPDYMRGAANAITTKEPNKKDSVIVSVIPRLEARARLAKRAVK